MLLLSGIAHPLLQKLQAPATGWLLLRRDGQNFVFDLAYLDKKTFAILILKIVQNYDYKRWP